MFETWVRAVRSAIPSSVAIARFDRPRATHAEDVALAAGQPVEAGFAVGCAGVAAGRALVRIRRATMPATAGSR